MKRIFVLILIIPLIVFPSWTGTWDKGYVVEEKVDTFPAMQLPRTGFTYLWDGYNIHDNSIEYLPWLRGPGDRFSSPIFQLLFNGNDSIYIDSLILVYGFLSALDDTDTVVFRIDTAKVVTSFFYYTYKDTFMTNQSSGLHSIAITDIGMNRLWAFNHPTVVLFYKNAGDTYPTYRIHGFIVRYKAYYKVR